MLVYDRNMAKKNKNQIMEKKLGITPDYQYKAIRSRLFPQANWHKNKLIVVNSLLKLNKKNVVLNLGSGSGNFELRFYKSVNKIVAVDYNDEAIEFLKNQLKARKIKNVVTLNRDIRKLSEVKKFGKSDYVLMIDVLEHVSLNEAKKVLHSIRPLLIKGGVVCVITPNRNSPWIFIEKVLDKFFNNIPKLDKAQHLAVYNQKNLIKLFTENDFEIKKVRSFNLFSYLSPISYFSRILALLEISLPLLSGNLLVGVFIYKDDSLELKES